MKKVASLVIAFVLLIGFFPNRSNAATSELKVHFINVGQGDSILIQSPDGKNMLIDGGPKSAGKYVVEFLKDKKIKKLDYVVATNNQEDHIGGLVDVLKAFTVSTFIESGYTDNSKVYADLNSIVKEKKIKVSVPKELDKLPFDSNMIIRVLHVNQNASNGADASIVLKLTYNKVSFLLMSDANIAIEDQIRSKYDVAATDLKNGQHGSNASSSAAFISNVKPQAAILSYDKKDPPHAAVEARLKNVGAKTYKTADHCNITVTTDGVKHSISSSCGKTADKPATAKQTTKPTSKVRSKPKQNGNLSSGTYVIPGAPTSFKNCTELRKYYPHGVKSSHPAYASKHDRDKDGWACEK